MIPSSVSATLTLSVALFTPAASWWGVNSLPLHLFLGVLGTVFVVVLMPIATDTKRVAVIRQVAYVGCSLILSYIAHYTTEQPSIGVQWADGLLEVLWSVSVDVRCFLLGTLTPNIMGILSMKRSKGSNK